MNKTKPNRLLRYLFWAWAIISVCWATFVIVENWSPDLSSLSKPDFWGEQHRACRDRLAFWPDGTRIEDNYFGDDYREYRRQLDDRQRQWVSYIEKKIEDCEFAEWAPIVIQERRQRLLVEEFTLSAVFFLLGAAIAFGRAWG